MIETSGDESDLLLSELGRNPLISRHHSNHSDSEVDHHLNGEMERYGNEHPHLRASKSSRGRYDEEIRETDQLIHKLSQKVNTTETSKASEGNLRHAFVTLIGLVIHSLADGLSFGCVSYASTTKEGNMFEFIIFLAIILHKCPAAIGFTSFLMNLKLEVNKVIQYLVVSWFSFNHFRSSLVHDHCQQ